MKKYLTVCAVVLLGACASNTLFPQTEGIVSTPASEKIEISTRTGTQVGKKVGDFKSQLNEIRGQLNAHTARLQKLNEGISANTTKYHEIVAVLESKLQLGTTPSNPHTVAMLNNAQNVLPDMEASVAELNELSGEVAALSTSTATMIRSIRDTYQLPGAVDEDHTNLRVLENGAEQTLISISNLVKESFNDFETQQKAIRRVRKQLLRLNVGVAKGSFGIDNLPLPELKHHPKPEKKEMVKKSGVTAKIKKGDKKSSTEPLFKVSFSSDDVVYQKELETSVNNVLAINENAHFEVVGINPVKSGSSEDAKAYAAQIFADLINMGIAPEFITLSAKSNNSVTVPSVWLFVK